MRIISVAMMVSKGSFNARALQLSICTDKHFRESPGHCRQSVGENSGPSVHPVSILRCRPTRFELQSEINLSLLEIAVEERDTRGCTDLSSRVRNIRYLNPGTQVLNLRNHAN